MNTSQVTARLRRRGLRLEFATLGWNGCSRPRIPAACMELLWSRAGANGGNRPLIGRARRRLRQAEFVADTCG